MTELMTVKSGGATPTSVPSTKYQVPSTKYQVLSTKNTEAIHG
jgi:hypothetical protein